MENNDNSKKNIALWNTVARKCDPSALVWAKNDLFKGGRPFICARVCDNSEAVSEKYIDWPIPDGSVPVEFFCLPRESFPRIAVVARDSIVPFYDDAGSQSGAINDESSSWGNKEKWNEAMMAKLQLVWLCAADTQCSQ